MRNMLALTLILMNLILLTNLPLYSEEDVDNTPDWYAVYQMLPEIPTDDDLDRCFNYLNERILLRAPDPSFVANYQSHSRVINRVVPVNLKEYPLKRFSRSENMPPPGFEGKTKREACRSSYKSLSLQLLRARLICEGKMAEGERDMTLLEKAMLCRYAIALIPWSSTEWPILCKREVNDWYAEQSRKLDERFGLLKAIDNKITSVCDGFGIVGATFEERLAKWEAIADEPNLDHFKSSALQHWLVINCTPDDILKDPKNVPISFRNGAPSIIEDYVKRSFFKMEDVNEVRGDRENLNSSVLKGMHLRRFLWTLLDDKFKCILGHNSLRFVSMKPEHIPFFSSTQRNQFSKPSVTYDYSVVNNSRIDEKRYQFELLKEGETGPAYFIGMHSPCNERGAEFIETDSIYPILFWHTNCPYGAEMLNSMYRIDFGFAPSINRTDLFYWSQNMHFLNEEPDKTDRNLFTINRDLEYDLTNEGRNKLMNDAALRKMYTNGSSFKTDEPQMPDGYDFPVVYKYNRARYKIYGFMHYDAETCQPGARFALCLMVVTPPDDSQPYKVLICPTSKKYATTIRKMGLSHYGDIVWTAAEFKTHAENMEQLKWIEDYTTKLHYRQKEENEEAKKRIEAFKRLFQYIPQDAKNPN